MTKREKLKIKDGRRVGNTTRLIDWGIQELFDTGSVFVWDHADRRDANGQSTNMAHEDHFRRLLRRLKDEHNLSIKKNLEYDTKTRVLKLKQLS